jgi:hypothetical protein
MPIPGGSSKAPSTFDSNKKGLKNKNDKNKFGTSSSDGKGKKFGEIKVLHENGPMDPRKYCIGCGAASCVNESEDIIL